MPAKKKTSKKKPAAKKKLVKKKVAAKKKVVKKPAKKATKKVAKRTTKKVTKKAAKKTAKKVSKKAVKKTAKKPVKKKSAAKKASTKKASTKKTSTKKTSARKRDLARMEAAVSETTSEPLLGEPKRITPKQPASYIEMEMIDVQTDETIVPSKTTVIGSLNFEPYPIKEGEEYMSSDQKGHFRKILDLWKTKLMSEVDMTVVHMKEDAAAFPDPIDRASQEEGFSLELRTRDRERKLIKKIEQSIDDIERGEYGYCEDCGTEIGIRRLEARPTADKCIDCKTFQEIREKQSGG